MPKRPKKQEKNTGRNDRRPNGKAWKGGLEPSQRAACDSEKAAAKRKRKELADIEALLA